MCIKVTIYSFPYSQLCMECKYSEFIHSENYNNSDYICKKNYEYNNGIHCDEKSLDEIEVLLETNSNLMEKLVEFDKYGKISN